MDLRALRLSQLRLAHLRIHLNVHLSRRHALIQFTLRGFATSR